MKKRIAPVLLLSFTLSAISPVQDGEAATKLALSNTKLSMEVGTTKIVKATKAVTWKTSNKKIAKVKKVSNKKARITAKKMGSCKITAIAGKKKATISVNVKKVTITNENPMVTATPTNIPTTVPEQKAIPTNTPTVVPEQKTTPTNTPTVEPEQKATPTAPNTSNNPVMDETGKISPEPTAVVPTSVEPTGTPMGTSTTKPTVEPTEKTVEEITKPTETPIKENDDLEEIPEVTHPVDTTTKPTATPCDSTIAPEGETTEPTKKPEEATATPSVEPTTPAEETTEPTVAPTITPTVVSESGIIMTLGSYENGKLTYTIENQSDKDWQYNYGYSIKKKENGEWVNVEPDRIVAGPAVILDLNCGDKVNDTENIKEIFDLQAGSYCFVKNFYAKDCKCMVSLSLPFEVTNTNVYQSGMSMTLDSYENGELTYTIENQTDDDVEYNYGYAIEKEVDGEWVSVEPDRNFNVPAVMLEVASGSSVCETINLLESFDLEAGNYRLVRNFYSMHHKCIYSLALPFEVEKTTMYFAGVRATVEGYEKGEITYTIENLTDEPVLYNPYSYSVSQKVDGEWVSVENTWGKPIPCVLFCLEAGEEEQLTTYIRKWKYLQAGTYNLYIDFYSSEIDFHLPFKITEEAPVSVSQAGVFVAFGSYENGALTYTVDNQSEQEICYSYAGISAGQNSDGEWSLLELFVEQSDNTDGVVSEGAEKENTVQLDLPAGSYYYLITCTMQGNEEVDTQSFTLALPFEVEEN